jgi:hypothetical protein
MLISNINLLIIWAHIILCTHLIRGSNNVNITFFLFLHAGWSLFHNSQKAGESYSLASIYYTHNNSQSLVKKLKPILIKSPNYTINCIIKQACKSPIDGVPQHSESLFIFFFNTSTEIWRFSQFLQQRHSQEF